MNERNGRMESVSECMMRIRVQGKKAEARASRASVTNIACRKSLDGRQRKMEKNKKISSHNCI